MVAAYGLASRRHHPTAAPRRIKMKISTLAKTTGGCYPSVQACAKEVFDMNARSVALLSLVVTLSSIAVPSRAEQKEPPAPARKRIVFVPGHQSHGWSGHAYTADCKLLARILNENVPQIEATVLEGGWPKDLKPLEGAAAIVIACDGNSLVGSESNWKALDALARKGVGLAFLHYSLDPGDKCGPYLLDWIGGYYKQHWSVNPSWLAQFKTLPEHPITRGVRPFRIEDEWYYHMKFRSNMEGVTPILSAVPPDSTRRGPDGPHSGNSTVRARRGMAEHVAWAYERPDGERGFGCTGGHTHWVYAQDDFRRLLLNAVCWIAKAEVPAGGVPTPTPTVQDMEANLAGERPTDWTADRTREIIERVNRQ